MFNRSLMIASTVFVFSTGALAQEVGTTKKAASYKDIVSGQTANVQLRSYLNQLVEPTDSSENGAEQVLTQVRGNYTLKMFQDKVASILTLAATSANDSEG